jgi:hypothetical protein
MSCSLAHIIIDSPSFSPLSPRAVVVPNNAAFTCLQTDNFSPLTRRKKRAYLSIMGSSKCWGGSGGPAGWPAATLPPPPHQQRPFLQVRNSEYSSRNHMPVSFTHCHAFGGVGLCVEQVGLPVRVWRENHACNLASENTGLAFFSTSLLSAPSFGWGRAARLVLKALLRRSATPLWKPLRRLCVTALGRHDT